MESLDVEVKTSAKVNTDANVGETKETQPHRTAQLNAGATASYLSAVARQKGLLAESSQRTYNQLTSNLNSYLTDPEAVESAAKSADKGDPGNYRKLTVQVINRDPDLQEKVAQDLSSSREMVRSRDAAATLESNLKNLPGPLSESVAAGKNLSKLICQSVVNLTDYENMGAGLQRDLAIREVFPPQNELSLRSKIATADTLSASIAYVKSNQPQVLATIDESAPVEKPKPGTSTPQIMTRYLRKALDEFPESSTYLDIFKQNRQKAEKAESEYNDEVSKNTAKRIQALIHKAADTARRGNLMPSENQERALKDVAAAAASDGAKNAAPKDASTLSLSELSARAAKLQQQFREERLKLAAEGKLPDPAARSAAPAVDSAAVDEVDAAIQKRLQTAQSALAKEPQSTAQSAEAKPSLNPDDIKKMAMEAVREALKETVKSQIEASQNTAKEVATQVANELKATMQSQLEASQNSAKEVSAKVASELKESVQAQLAKIEENRSVVDNTTKLISELKEQIESNRNTANEATLKMVNELKSQLEATQNSAKEVSAKVASELKESVQAQLAKIEENRSVVDNTTKMIGELKEQLEASRNAANESTLKMVSELRAQLEATQNSTKEVTSQFASELKESVRAQLEKIEAQQNLSESTTKMISELKAQIEATQNSAKEATSQVAQELKESVRAQLEKIEAQKNVSESTSKLLSELKAQIEATQNSAKEATSQVAKELQASVRAQLEKIEASRNVPDNTSKMISELKAQLEASQNSAKEYTSQALKEVLEKAKESAGTRNTPLESRLLQPSLDNARVNISYSTNNAPVYGNYASQSGYGSSVLINGMGIADEAHVSDLTAQTTRDRISLQQNAIESASGRIAEEGLKEDAQASVQTEQAPKQSSQSELAQKESAKETLQSEQASRQNPQSAIQSAEDSAYEDRSTEKTSIKVSRAPLEMNIKDALKDSDELISADSKTVITRSNIDRTLQQNEQKARAEAQAVLKEETLPPLVQNDTESVQSEGEPSDADIEDMVVQNIIGAPVAQNSGSDAAAAAAAKSAETSASAAAPQEGSLVQNTALEAPLDQISPEDESIPDERIQRLYSKVSENAVNASPVAAENVPEAEADLVTIKPAAAPLQNQMQTAPELSAAAAEESSVTAPAQNLAAEFATFTPAEDLDENFESDMVNQNAKSQTSGFENGLLDEEIDSQSQVPNPFASSFNSAQGIGTAPTGSADPSRAAALGNGLTLEQQAMMHSAANTAQLGGESFDPDLPEQMNSSISTEIKNAVQSRPSVLSGSTEPQSAQQAQSQNTPAQSLSAKIMSETIPEDELSEEYIPKDVQKSSAVRAASGAAPADSEFTMTKVPAKTPGAAAITSGESAPIPQETVVEDVSEIREKSGLLSRIASLFGGRKHAQAVHNAAPAEAESSAQTQGSASASLMAMNPQESPLDVLTRSLKAQINNPALPAIVRDQARDFLKQLENPIDDLPAVTNWLNFTSSPLTPSSSMALALHQWAFTLLSIRFSQLGKSVDKFLRKDVDLMEDVFDDELKKISKGLGEGSRGTISSLIDDTFEQVSRFQKPVKENLPALFQYIPLPPSYDGGREGAMNARPVVEEDGKKSWHLTFVFDLKGLGPIEIKAVTKFPELKLSVVASSVEGLQKIQENLPYLREKLQDIGITTRSATARLGTVHIQDDRVSPSSTGIPRNDGSSLSVDI